MSLLFLGVGHPDRGDDGVGPRMAEKFLADPRFAAACVDVISHGGEGVSLMSLWEGLEKVVVVDAMMSHRKAGLIQRFEAHEDKLNGGVFRYSSHLFGLAEAVEMARALGKLPKSLVIYGIEGKDFVFGEPPSAAVTKATKKVETEVLKEFGLGGGV